MAALLVLSGLAMAEWLYSGSDAPDWQGYKALYEGSADWLTPNSVAPLFIAFLDGARGIFGEQEYGLFRLALFAIFATFAAWLAYIMPIQRRLGGASALMTGGAVLTALLLKSVVQVREGLAFIVVLVGVLALLRRGHFGGARSGAAVLIAPFIHAGIGPLSGVWLVALSLSRAPWKVLERRWLHRALAATSAIIGLALGLLVVGNGETIAVYAASAGIDISAAEQGGFFKLLYWAAVGVAVLILARQSIWWDGGSKLAFSFSVTLAMVLLPLAYAFCVVLVVAGFEVPAVTSMGIRILFTGLDLALIMVCLRGRADLLTALVTVCMLADELRLLASG